MRFATFDGETEIEALVRRVYAIRGRGSKEQSQLAAQALLDANPKLANLSLVRRGEMLKIPPVAAIKPTAEIQPLRSAVSAMIQAAQLQLKGLEVVLEERAAEHSDKAKKMLDLSISNDIQKLATKEPLLKQRLPKIRETLKKILADKEKLKTARKDGFNVLRAEFTRLANLGSHE